MVFDEHGGRLQSVILRGRAHCFGLLGCDDDLILPWESIRTIGTDVIMVDAGPLPGAPPLMSENRIFCVKFRKKRLYFLGYYAIIKIQQAESEESAMQTTRRLAVLTVLAAVLIAAGALFLIARSGNRSALPLRMSRRRWHTAAPEAPTLIDINTATAED